MSATAGLASLSEALRQVIQKFTDFFDTIDLSFFVAGAMTFAALAFHVEQRSAVTAEAHHKAVRFSVQRIAGLEQTKLHADADVTRAEQRVAGARAALAPAGSLEGERSVWQLELAEANT